MAKPTSTRSNRRGELTRALLLETTVELLGTTPVDDVTLAMVLERAGTTSGSIYHHFDDFADLIEQAVAVRYAQGLRASLVGVRSLLDCADAAEFRSRSEELFRVSVIAPSANRLYRVEVMGLVQSRPRLAERIARVQQEITETQADLYREFQRRGWMRSDIDALGLSAFVQAMILGHVVDDIAERQIDDDVWADIALRALRTLVHPD